MSITEPHSFFGLGRLLRRFVPSFARIAVLLKWELEMVQAIHFGKLSAEELKETKKLEDKLMTPPMLVLPYDEAATL